MMNAQGGHSQIQLDIKVRGPDEMQVPASCHHKIRQRGQSRGADLKST